MAMSLFDLIHSLYTSLAQQMTPKACKVVPYIFYPCVIIE